MTTYVRKPFLVDAVEITDENISELAGFVGTLQNKDDGTIYIQVDRPITLDICRAPAKPASSEMFSSVISTASTRNGLRT